MSATAVSINNKAYHFVGTTDEVTNCCCCGRTGLKGTIVLRGADGGNFVYFGAVCASKALGWTVKDVNKTAKQADADRKQAIKARKFQLEQAHSYTKTINDEIKAANAVVPRMSFEDRKPLIIRWAELRKERDMEINTILSQEFGI